MAVNKMWILLSAALLAAISCSGGEEPGPTGGDDTAQLSGILPNSGYAGQVVTITARNLGGDAEFYFEGKKASFVPDGENRYKVTVPEVSAMGRIVVWATTGGKETNRLRFTNKEAPEEPEIPEYDNEDGKGRKIHKKARPYAALSRTGPFKKLSDGRIMRVGGTSCEFSSDNGIQWRSVALFDDNNKYGTESPVCAEAADGTLVIAFSNIKEISPLNWNKSTHCYDPTANLPLYVIYSTNKGQTWSTPKKLHDGWTGMNRDLLATSDGKLVIVSSNMRNNYGRHCVVTYTSSDNGKNWTASNMIDKTTAAGDHDGYMEATIVEKAQNKLWMLIRTNWDYFYESTSTDGGVSWSTPVKTSIDASSSPGALMKLESGRIVLVWNRLYRKGETWIERTGGDMNLSKEAASWQRDQLSIMYSDDGCLTWSEPKLLAWNKVQMTNPWDSGKWLSYPHIMETEPGKMLITSGHGSLAIELEEKDI